MSKRHELQAELEQWLDVQTIIDELVSNMSDDEAIERLSDIANAYDIDLEED